MDLKTSKERDCMLGKLFQCLTALMMSLFHVSSQSFPCFSLCLLTCTAAMHPFEELGSLLLDDLHRYD